MTGIRAQMVTALEGVRREYARRWAVLYRPAGRIGPPPGEGVIDGREHPHPHADERVMHAPHDCVRCDAFPVRQRARYEAGINFTGRYSPLLEPCPTERGGGSLTPSGLLSGRSGMTRRVA